MFLDVINHLINCGKSKSHVAVRTSVVKGDLAAFGIVNRCAGEAYIGNETFFFVPVFGCEKIIFTAVLNDGGIVDIKDCAAD